MITRCPACQHDDSVRRFDKDGHRVRACRSCRTWFVADPPSADRLGEIYRERYFTDRLGQHGPDPTGSPSWRSAVANARRRLALIRRHAPRARRLLDVGCGTGAFLSVARDSYACAGQDVSAEAAAVVRDRLGLPAYGGELAALDPTAGRFDVVTLFDVIEHVPEPAATLRTVCRLLAPRGIVLITTGDVDSLICRLTGRWWHLMTPPEHLTFFSRDGLTRVVVRQGLAIRHVSHQPVAANVGYMAAKLADGLGAPFGWLPRFVSACGLARLDLDVNLLDVVTMVASAGGT